ncbi:MAG TPA: AAA family ATPase [Thermoanaerobaculia bacterium]|nr:AAA family ATPase [Thermoanaerobaculia bacterium]
MYVLKAEIVNVKSIGYLTWSVPLEQAAGWHVVLGDNGSGKSSVLRAIGLALVGHENALALRLPLENWVRKGAKEAKADLSLYRHEDLDGSGALKAVGRQEPPHVDFNIINTGNEQDVSQWRLGSNSLDRLAKGWFSAAYGPFRRFSGSDEQYDKISSRYPRLARHLSLFDERFALTETLEWLRQLRFEQLEEGEQPGHLLDKVKAFVNEPDFLPFGAQLQEISSKQVIFVDGNGCEVPVEELSDGYRSILSMTFELIRQLAREYGPETLFDQKDPSRIVAPGVVLVDEIDAHLHPTWQRRVGPWFRKHFPNMQFIVTTHSPLVCQAAETGTVFRLAQPGSGEEPGMVTGNELNRLLYGNILDAYGTGLFGDGVTRSPESEKLLDRLAHLNLKEINEGLSRGEVQEQDKLRATLPTAAYAFK